MACSISNGALSTSIIEGMKVSVRVQFAALALGSGRVAATFVRPLLERISGTPPNNRTFSRIPTTVFNFEQQLFVDLREFESRPAATAHARRRSWPRSAWPLASSQVSSERMLPRAKATLESAAP
jgi:hypothetical protein